MFGRRAPLCWGPPILHRLQSLCHPCQSWRWNTSSCGGHLVLPQNLSLLCILLHKQKTPTIQKQFSIHKKLDTHTHTLPPQGLILFTERDKLAITDVSYGEQKDVKSHCFRENLFSLVLEGSNSNSACPVTLV